MTSARSRVRWALHPATAAVVLLVVGALGVVLDQVALLAMAAGAAAGFANSGST